ncbi:MAG TPA: undecaprenyl-phosphate glucose phosphotransferase [Pseudorhodoplanes sp.]|nr:undecaprenyl-phosphate glucose phosphotransferase [Pseudorhodoplanes sp.]
MTIDAQSSARVRTAEFPWDWSRRTSARDLWRAALADGDVLAPSIPKRTSRKAQEISARTVPLLAVTAEFVAMVAATFGAGSLYHHVMVGTLPSPLFYLFATMALSALYVAQCALARDHSVRRLLEPKDELRSVFMRWNSSFSLFVFALFMSHATDFYSRGSIVAQYVAGIAVAAIVRVVIMGAVARGLRTGRIRGRKAVVVGERSLLDSLLPRLSRPGSGASIVDVIALEENFDLAPADAVTEDVRTLAQIHVVARRTEADDIVLALSWTDKDRIRAFTEGLASVPATIHLAPDETLGWVREPELARVGGDHTLRLSRAPLTVKDHFIKRVFDLTAALGLLLLASPLLALIAVMIRLDSPGPALFRQRRNGFNQREFRVFKFRTMTTLDDGNVVRQATRNDGRVTRIGRFLRRTNLDEVPQLLNVILGDMSLVGPRPHAVAHNSEYEERIGLYARRHNVKPGITGWAQVNGLRGATDSIDKMQRRVEYDLFYIDHWSVLFDIKILLMTLLSPRAYRNAY